MSTKSKTFLLIHIFRILKNQIPIDNFFLIYNKIENNNNNQYTYIVLMYAPIIFF